MNKPIKVIPKFANEAEEPTFWEKHNPTDYLDWAKAKRIVMPNLEPTTKTISLRKLQHLLDSIKVAANSRDVPYQSLIKVWLKRSCIVTSPLVGTQFKTPQICS
jgi:predicted DNA binding CopG/RHH family protein